MIPNKLKAGDEVRVGTTLTITIATNTKEEVTSEKTTEKTNEEVEGN